MFSDDGRSFAVFPGAVVATVIDTDRPKQAWISSMMLMIFASESVLLKPL
jgi:hypothetical protein